MKDPAGPISRATKASGTTVVGILAAISTSHLLNDTIQSLVPSTYPIAYLPLVGLLTAFLPDLEPLAMTSLRSYPRV